MVPANDGSRAVGADDSVSDLIENPLGEPGLDSVSWCRIEDSCGRAQELTLS
jgi:hypothetical protein